MNRKICVLLAAIILVSGTPSLAVDNASNAKDNNKKIENVFWKKKTDKVSANKVEKANVEQKTKKTTLKKSEMPKESVADVPDTVFSKKSDNEVNAVVKKENKKTFTFFNKKTKKDSTPNDVEIVQEVVVPEATSADLQTKKLQRVTKSTEPKLNNAKEIQMLDEGIKNASVMQASISTNKIISVDDCVKLALENHPSIKSAMSSADIYKSKIAQAWSAYFPVLGLDLNYSRNNMLITSFEIPTQTYNQYNVPKVSANWMLFDFGKTKAAVDISKKSFEASQDNIQMSINDVIYNVKKSYYNLLFAIQQEKVYQETVKDFDLHLKQAKAFYAIGTKPKIDVMTAEYNLGKSKLDLIKAKNNVSLAYAQVSNAMGLPEFHNYNIADKLDTWSYNVKFDNIIEIAYGTRPELLAAKKKAEGSELLIRASKRAFAPDINAFGNYTLGGKTPGNDYGYQLGAGLTYNSTNLMLLKKQVDEAKATYKRDLADYENRKQSVYLDVRSAYLDLKNAQDSIPVAKLSLSQAKEQYRLASGRYKVGLGDAIELKDAENTYRNAKLDYYSSLLNYNVSAANVERVVGAPISHTDKSLL